MNSFKDQTDSSQNQHMTDESNPNMDELKPQINNLLMTFLPDDITIKEADIIAMAINNIIWNPRDFITKVNELHSVKNEESNN